MKFTCGLTLTLPLLLVLLLVVATKGHTVIDCYVCENCEKVDKNTPTQKCGGENMITTTTTSTSMPSTSESATTTPSETTTSKITTMPHEHPVKPNSSSETATSTPIGGNPSPIFVSSTTTPEDTIKSADNKNATSPSIPMLGSNTTTIGGGALGNLTIPAGFTNDVSLHNRQRRHTTFNNTTFYCYKVQKKYGNVFGTKRGCMGVEPKQSVCTELNTANGNNTKKCSECDTSLCNSSSTIGVSITALLVVLLAVIFKV